MQLTNKIDKIACALL